MSSRSLSSTLAGGHEYVFDWTCQQCEDLHSKISEATAYCQECGRGYCQPCLKVHAQFPVMQRHTVLGSSRISEWGNAVAGSRSGSDVTRPKCTEHVEEAVSLYCGNHDDVCCPVCVSLDHKECKDTHYIPTISKDVRQSPEFRYTEKDLDQTMKQAQTIRAKKKTYKTMLDASRTNVVQVIKDFRHDVLDIFDDLEKAALDDMNKAYGTLEDELKKEEKACDDIESGLGEMKQRLQSTVTNDSGLFVNMKNVQKEMPKSQDNLQALATDPERYRFSIELNPAIKKLMTGVKSLGNITTDYPIAMKYTVKKSKSLNVRSNDDTETCFISGLCQLPNGQLLCSDYNNRKVKLLDNGCYKMIDCCKMPEKPRGLACISDNEAAVVLKNRAVQFLSISDAQIVPTRSFPLDCNCYGLAYHTGQIYVSSMLNKVFIYDVAGSLLSTIQKNEIGADVFSNPRNFAISMDGKHVHVADVHRGLVTLDRDGNHLSTITDPRLRSAFGVSIDVHDNVFVSGFDSSNVVQFGKGCGSVVGEVMRESDRSGRANPITLCFDKCHHRLIVTSNPKAGCDSAHVFHFV